MGLDSHADRCRRPPPPHFAGALVGAWPRPCGEVRAPHPRATRRRGGAPARRGSRATSRAGRDVVDRRRRREVAPRVRRDARKRAPVAHRCAGSPSQSLRDESQHAPLPTGGCSRRRQLEVAAAKSGTVWRRSSLPHTGAAPRGTIERTPGRQRAATPTVRREYARRSCGSVVGGRRSRQRCVPMMAARWRRPGVPLLHPRRHWGHPSW